MANGGASAGLRCVLRTPQGAVFDGQVRAMRVPTETGQVGLRPRGEPCSSASSRG